MGIAQELWYILGSGGCVHLGLPVCLLMAGLSLGSTDTMAAQVFQGRWGVFSTSKSVWLPCGKGTAWHLSVWAKARGSQRCWVSGVRAGLMWHSSVKVQWEHWAWRNTKPFMSWAGQLEKDLLLVSLFFQLRTWFKLPWQTSLTGINCASIKRFANSALLTPL